jgi:hypothetical protein
MNITKEELIERLPHTRDFWFVGDVAQAMEVHKRTIQRVAKNHNLGRKIRHGPRGTYVFQDHDLQPLCEFVYGEVGNPVNIAKYRARMGV